MTNNPNPPRPISRLYARYFTFEEKKSLRAVPVEGVSSEINLLRVLNVLFMQVQQTAPKDLDSNMQALRTCTMLCAQLAILVRLQDKEHSPMAEWDDLLAKVLAENPFDLVE